MKELTNRQLSEFINSFGYNDKGSNYLFENFANEVLNRKIRNFNEEEFKRIYSVFKSNNIKDKILCAILNRAKIKIHPYLKIE